MTSAQRTAVTPTATVPVTVENFIRAESDLYFTVVAVEEGFFGKLGHHREVMPVDHQTIIRTNRDTLYTSGVFDLDAGPVTVTLPDPGRRFMSLQMISQDEYSPRTQYAPGTYTFTREQAGTRYIVLGVRTLVDPSDPADLAKVHALQDALKVDQKSPGPLTSQIGIRSARRRCATR
jgi:hypothetical protein